MPVDSLPSELPEEPILCNKEAAEMKGLLTATREEPWLSNEDPAEPKVIINKSVF